MIGILTALPKTKVMALLLGPAGVGFIGLYTNFIGTAAAAAALGLGAAGVRQIASASSSEDSGAVDRIRRAIRWYATILAVVGATVVAAFSPLIARFVFNDSSRTGDVLWLSLAVGLTVGSTAQSAILTGLHRVGDIVRVNIATSVLGAVLSVIAVWILRQDGVLAVVLAPPVITYVVGYFYVRSLGPPKGQRPTLGEFMREWRSLAIIGFFTMSGVLIVQFGGLMIRTQVQRGLGPEALGQYQAATGIAVYLSTFIISTMVTDYFPRLTAAIKDAPVAVRLINEQVEAGLLLCLPPILALIGFGPWVIHVMYSPQFAPGVVVLQWQLLGDVCKIVGWPLGYALLAAGSVRLLAVNDFILLAVLLAVLPVSLHTLGLEGAGVAYLLMNLSFLPLPWFFCKRGIDFRWGRAVRVQAAIFVVTVMAVIAACHQSQALGAATGGLLAAATGAWTVRRISQVVGVNSKLGAVARIRDRLTPGRRRPRDESPVDTD